MNQPLPPLNSHTPRMDDAAMWSDVGAQWLRTSKDRLWRKHSDAMTGELIDQWLGSSYRALLKTDLFDEVVTDGLFPALQSITDAVHGIDVAADIVDAAAQRHPKLTAQVADIRALPFETGAFDAMVSTSTLDHFDTVDDIFLSLREMRRVMATDGDLLLTLDNPSNPKLALRAVLPETLLIKAGLVPYRCGETLGRHDLAHALQVADFQIVETKAFLHCPRVMAVKIAALIERVANPKWETRLHRSLRRFEALGRWPTAWQTGHFTAVLARAA